MNRQEQFPIFAAALAIAAVLAACDRAPPVSSGTIRPMPAEPVRAAVQPRSAADDLYDPSKMDFKPGTAALSTERHTGPFAAGSALSMDAAVKPLVSDAGKEIRLDTTHKIIEIAPGVKFSAWTFGYQVPGPVIRARVGDRIKFSMTNRSDEHMPGVTSVPAPTNKGKEK